MKVRKVWECECGTTTLLKPSKVGDKRLIVKGNGGAQTEPISRATTVIAFCCSSKYLVSPPVISANGLEKIWKCQCGTGKAYTNEKAQIITKGDIFAYGSPPTRLKCKRCGDSYPIGLDIVWASHLLAKAKKKRRKVR